MGVEPRPEDYKYDTRPYRPLTFLYPLCLKQSPVLYITMHDWFCQIEPIEWRERKADLKESSNALNALAVLHPNEMQLLATIVV